MKQHEQHVGDRYAYRYPTRPVGPRGQVEASLRGKVLGGSTAVNGMMWTRGTAADWDGLAARGNPAFGWLGVLAAPPGHGPGRRRCRRPPNCGSVGHRSARRGRSARPVQVAGNTQASAMAVAWIAADLIREDS